LKNEEKKNWNIEWRMLMDNNLEIDEIVDSLVFI